MYKEEITLLNQTGLHARPASLFVKEASQYKSDIKVIKDGQEYNGKSIMGILSMGAGKGDVLTIQAQGEDEEKAVKNLVDLIANQLRD
ncbi:HPr family phosphocarrier protein [Wansuia hejianensis]|uniref:Phosphocarrier protein HPr n=1 Tax=Wansuia hejianensis TaxID=2763667 RepID=A0A926INC4_9FIRM|nr:HPr family phosphocarrier protein [Wansuia hejianensis]MBC8591526.1 HPr family phosphocarrier protein [Wansuia hejianensis]